jgi:hypothetical protein
MITNNSKIIYEKDTFQEYLGKKDHISSSDIKNFMKSPKVYHYSKYEDTKKGDEDLRHLIIGSALHESILEPHQFFENYVVSPKFDRRTKDGKIVYETFKNENKGKRMLYEDEMEMIIRMGSNALTNKSLIELSQTKKIDKGIPYMQAKTVDFLIKRDRKSVV